ncbi:hypothetical protein [Kitasatospora phosalacinea]|uniref:Capsid maturation protease n=1 Tax=Kitasatospora phosalacinea TaxID=2065 RepID=A0ABW6GS84_9ACTN
MATVSDGGGAMARWRAAQQALTRLLGREVRRIRQQADPAHPEKTVPRWIALGRALNVQYGRASASLGAEFYDAQRAAAKVPGRFNAPPADPAPAEQVVETLRWATSGLWETGADAPPAEARLDLAEQQTAGALQKLTVDAGRQTVRAAAQADPQAVAYARAAALGACSFCKLMASRGAVYKTAGTAGQDADERFTGEASTTKFHDNCHCGIVPVFRGQRFELSPHAAEWDRIYQEFAAGHPGDQLRLFRRALAEQGQLPQAG